MIVVCDNCHKRFKPQILNRILPDAIVRAYIRCPKCQTEYLCFYTDQRIRNMQRLQRSTTDIEELTTRGHQIGELMKELKEKMEGKK